MGQHKRYVNGQSSRLPNCSVSSARTGNNQQHRVDEPVTPSRPISENQPTSSSPSESSHQQYLNDTTSSLQPTQNSQRSVEQPMTPARQTSPAKSETQTVGATVTAHIYTETVFLPTGSSYSPQIRSQQFEGFPLQHCTPTSLPPTRSSSCRSNSSSGTSDSHKSPSKRKKDKFKTVECTNSEYLKTGICSYQGKCRFAHGKQELRVHPNHKTIACNDGRKCTFRWKCTFRHPAEHEAYWRQMEELNERVADEIRGSRPDFFHMVENNQDDSPYVLRQETDKERRESDYASVPRQVKRLFKGDSEITGCAAVSRAGNFMTMVEDPEVAIWRQQTLEKRSQPLDEEAKQMEMDFQAVSLWQRREQEEERLNEELSLLLWGDLFQNAETTRMVDRIRFWYTSGGRSEVDGNPNDMLSRDGHWNDAATGWCTGNLC